MNIGCTVRRTVDGFITVTRPGCTALIRKGGARREGMQLTYLVIIGNTRRAMQIGEIRLSLFHNQYL